MGHCLTKNKIFVKDTINNCYDDLFWKSRDECCVCLENSCSVLLLPCNHLVLCENCMNYIQDICPVCQTSIYSYNFLRITSVNTR